MKLRDRCLLSDTILGLLALLYLVSFIVLRHGLVFILVFLLGCTLRLRLLLGCGLRWRVLSLICHFLVAFSLLWCQLFLFSKHHSCHLEANEWFFCVAPHADLVIIDYHALIRF